MALRNQPYIPLYVQDFLTDEKLIECSALATGVYIRIMCIMHKSEEYGTILLKQKDKQNEKQILNFAFKLAKFLPWDLQTIRLGLEELLSEEVIHIEGDLLIQKRMRKDGVISDKRASAGSKGGNNSLKKRKNESDFAQAKSQANIQANSEYESEYKSENENNFGKESMREKPKIPFDEIIQIFNSVCSDLSKVEKITDSRKKAISARIKEYSLETLGEVFKKVAESDYLSGRKNGVDWKATFDWVMNPNNFIKILEDNYKNKILTPSEPKEQVFGRMPKSTVEKNFMTLLNSIPDGER